MLSRRVLSVIVILSASACGDPAPADDEGWTAVTSDEGSTGATSSSTGGDSTSLVTEPWMTSGESTSTTTSTTASSGTSSTTVEPTTTTTDASDTDTSTTGDPLADCPRLRVVVAQGEVLNVRPTPSTAMAPIGTLANGLIVDTVDAVDGEAIDGVSLWYQIDGGGLQGYVFSGFVECTFDEPPPPPEGFWLPLTCGSMVKIAQGNNGDFSHQGKDYYAFDFSVPLNTPLLAMAPGVVDYIYDQTKPGDPCYNGGGPECAPYGNLVVILHGDNTESYYKHLNQVQVTLGEVVERGHQIGLSGSTGYSTGPHCHVMRQENCGQAKCQSIPLSFVECGVPVTGQVVTSENCP